MLQLTIEDTSPQIYYSPFRDTLSTPDLNGGWNPYYGSSGFAAARGQTGIGASYQITSMDGAFLSLTWQGNGIQLFGNTTRASYSIVLDGSEIPLNTTNSLQSNGILFDVNNLQDGNHTVDLTALIPEDQIPRNSSMVMFDKAIIQTLADDASSTATSIWHPLASDNIAFYGGWSFQPISSGQSFHISSTMGDRVNTTFNGTAFILLGMTTPEAGNYSVTLDGITTRLMAQSSFIVPNTTLFFATNLNTSAVHTLEVRNEGGTLSLLQLGFETYSASQHRPPDLPTGNVPNASYSSGTIAAFALAGVLGFVLIISGLYYYCFVWRDRQQRRNTFQFRNMAKRGSAIYRNGSLTPRAVWPIPGRTRTSYEAGSLGGGKGDVVIIEAREVRVEDMDVPFDPPDRSRVADSGWRREGDVRGIALPIFNHSPSAAGSQEPDPSEQKHPYVRYTLYDRPQSDRSAELDNGLSNSGQESRDLGDVALANLRNKGKARKISGADSSSGDPDVPRSRRSWSPNLLQGLHVKIKKKKNWARFRTPQGSLSLSLNPSSSPVLGQSGGYGDSGVSRLASFRAAANSSSPQSRDPPLSATSPQSTGKPPSVPRTVSDLNTITPIRSDSHHYRQGSRMFLLEDEREFDDRLYEDEAEDYYHSLPPPPQIHVYRNQDDTNQNQSSVNRFSLRQVIRGLSPRTSVAGTDVPRYTRPALDYAYPNISDEQSPEDEQRLMGAREPSIQSEEDTTSSLEFARDVSPSLVGVSSSRTALPPNNGTAKQRDETPLFTEGDQPERDQTLSPVLPSLRRTSPFEIKFDWQTEQSSGAARALEGADTSQTKNWRQRASETSRLEVPLDDSGRCFRLSPATPTFPPGTMPSYAPSQLSGSFLDLTTSSEASVRSKSYRTFQSEKIFGDSSAQLPGAELHGTSPQELKSRWSDTTASTRHQESSLGDASLLSGDRSRRNTQHTSFQSTNPPPSIQLTSDFHSIAISSLGRRQSNQSNFSSDPSNEHPAGGVHRSLSDAAAELPAAADTSIASGRRLSDAFGLEESSGSRRTADSSIAFHTRVRRASRYPPLPEGTEEASTNSRGSLSPSVDNP